MGKLFLFLMSSLLLWLGIKQFKINRKRTTEGVIVQARVISNVEYPRQRGGPYYRPVVQFVTQSGNIINAELENSAKPEYAIGESIEVVYHPDNPNQVTTTTWFANNVGPIFCLVAGVVCLLVFIFNVLH